MREYQLQSHLVCIQEQIQSSWSVDFFFSKCKSVKRLDSSGELPRTISCVDHLRTTGVAACTPDIGAGQWQGRPDPIMRRGMVFRFSWATHLRQPRQCVLPRSTAVVPTCVVTHCRRPVLVPRLPVRRTRRCTLLFVMAFVSTFTAAAGTIAARSSGTWPLPSLLRSSHGR